MKDDDHIRNKIADTVIEQYRKKLLHTDMYKSGVLKDRRKRDRYCLKGDYSFFKTIIKKEIGMKKEKYRLKIGEKVSWNSHNYIVVRVNSNVVDLASTTLDKVAHCVPIKVVKR